MQINKFKRSSFYFFFFYNESGRKLLSSFYKKCLKKNISYLCPPAPFPAILAGTWYLGTWDIGSFVLVGAYGVPSQDPCPKPGPKKPFPDFWPGPDFISGPGGTFQPCLCHLTKNFFFSSNASRYSRITFQFWDLKFFICVLRQWVKQFGVAFLVRGTTLFLYYKNLSKNISVAVISKKTSHWQYKQTFERRFFMLTFSSFFFFYIYKYNCSEIFAQMIFFLFVSSEKAFIIGTTTLAIVV